jgi:hypothetical protein
MDVNTFWQTVNVLLTKFNVINKRLWGSKIVCRCGYKLENKEWKAPIESIKKMKTEDFECYLKSIEEAMNVSHKETKNNYSVEFVIIELLPKKFTDKKGYQLICLNQDKVTATFYDITPEINNHNLCPNFTYSLALENNNVVLTSATSK